MLAILIPFRVHFESQSMNYNPNTAIDFNKIITNYFSITLKQLFLFDLQFCVRFIQFFGNRMPLQCAMSHIINIHAVGQKIKCRLLQMKMKLENETACSLA